MDVAPDPDWYLDNVLVHASPGVDRIAVGPAAAWQAWWHTAARRARNPAQVLALSQGFVATTAQLDALGWQRHDHRRVRRRGEWSVVRAGVSSPVRVDDGGSNRVVERRQHALRCAAAVRCRPGHAVSGASAAILHGLPTVAVPERVELTAVDTRATTLGARTSAHVFGATLPSDAVRSWFGVPVTGVARTLTDLGRHSRDDAIMAVDAALRERLTSRARIVAELDRAAGWPGVRNARDVLALADPDAESPLESLLRLRLHDDGFPTPRLQVEIRDGGRDRAYRVDLLIDQARLIIEADGRIKYGSRVDDRDEQWREKRRESWLRSLGYQVERVLWSDLFDGWPQMRAQLWAAVRDRRFSPAGMDHLSRR